MWIRYESFDELHDAYLLTLGRGMLLAQSFEDMCKRTLLWWNAAKRISEGNAVDLQAMAQYTDQFLEKFLGIALNKLVEGHRLNSSDEKIFSDGRSVYLPAGGGEFWAYRVESW